MVPKFYYRQPAAKQIPAVPPPKPRACDKPDPLPREIPEAPFADQTLCQADA